MNRPHGDERHFSERIGWLRAAFLGANDGILSTARAGTPMFPRTLRLIYNGSTIGRASGLSERISMRRTPVSIGLSAAAAACLVLSLSCNKNEQYSQHFNKASDETFKRDMSDLSSVKLANGITLYMQEERTDNEVAICAVYRSGYTRDPKGKVQLAHLVEHMSMKCASGPYKAGETMSKVQDRRGGMISAEAVADFIHIDYIVDAANLDEALAIEASRLRGLSCDAITLQEAQKAVVGEFPASFKDPKANISHVSLGALTQIVYYGETFIPLEAGVAKLTLDDVTHFHDANYRPDDMVLVMIGNFKKADAEALVRKHFESIPSRPAPPEPTFAIKQSVKATWDVPTHVAYFIAPGPFNAKESLILTMFGAFVQQLFLNSPDVYNNCQAIYTSNQSYPARRLPFFVFVQAQEGFGTDKVVPALFGRLDQAAKALDDDKQVELIKSSIASYVTSSGLKLDEPDYPMMHYQVIGQEALMVALKHMLLNGRSPDEFAADVQAITPEEFRAVVKKRLSRSALLSIAIDPRG